MSIICFTSLKGGVGKTSMSLNVGHALAKMQQKTIFLDLDPAAHASRYFQGSEIKPFNTESPLAHLFLKEKNFNNLKEHIIHVRTNYDLIKGGAELRHFYWGRSATSFKTFFPQFIEYLKQSYDNIVVDTAPDFNVLLRNAIAVSNMVVVPIDSSAMSIDCLEELFNYCGHITKPDWSIIRTMVNSSATQVRTLSNSSIEQKLHNKRDEKPIYLLNSFVNRTENQNRLSFLHRTAFDLKDTKKLAEQYSAVALEIKGLLAYLAEPENDAENLSLAM
ncbi:MAG: ParA family protein [Deltaproteobacteria bacterium]|jgi:chromosome partitioning protein|nr:ParA family protein [Deltaproteobacteria bacterium]